MTERPVKRGKARYISIEPQRRGPKPRFFDEFHVRAREANRRYYWRKKLGCPIRPYKKRDQNDEESEEISEEK